MGDDREQLRDRIADTLYLRWLERATAKLAASPEDHCTDLADQVMGVVSVEIDRAVAAGRRQAAESLFETLRAAGFYAVHTPDGRIYQLADVAFAVAEPAPAEPVEEAIDG